jgi:hypothetical protein
MTVPDGFDAYARIFFPFVGPPIVRASRAVDNERITWTEVAARNRKAAHALMEVETITATDSGPGGAAPVCGSLSAEQEDALWPILARHTTSTLGWSLLWEGHGGLDPRPYRNQPRVDHHGLRRYHLLRGPLAARDALPNPPGYVWPEDRAWCLCGDIDFYWAYLAGSGDCVQEVIATAILDAYPTQPSDPARSGMDTVNDPDGSVPRRP